MNKRRMRRQWIGRAKWIKGEEVDECIVRRWIEFRSRGIGFQELAAIESTSNPDWIFKPLEYIDLTSRVHFKTNRRRSSASPPPRVECRSFPINQLDFIRIWKVFFRCFSWIHYEPFNKQIVKSTRWCFNSNFHLHTHVRYIIEEKAGEMKRAIKKAATAWRILILSPKKKKIVEEFKWKNKLEDALSVAVCQQFMTHRKSGRLDSK